MEVQCVYGIDLGKNSIQAHGIDDRGNVQITKVFKRIRVLAHFANLRSCLIGMEACGGSHYWARELAKLGHTVKLMPAQNVKPYAKTTIKLIAQMLKRYMKP